MVFVIIVVTGGAEFRAIAVPMDPQNPAAKIGTSGD
jgi:hypothetical protein